MLGIGFSEQRTHTHSQRNEDVLMVTNSVQRCLRCEVNGGAVLFICSAHGFIKINWMNTVRVCARHASNVYAVEKKRAILHIYGNNCIFVGVLILNDGCEICTIDNRCKFAFVFRCISIISLSHLHCIVPVS